MHALDLMPGNHGRLIHAGCPTLYTRHEQAGFRIHKPFKIVGHGHKTLTAASAQIANDARQVVHSALVRIMEQKNIGNVIDKDHRYRDSPFDAVPQIVGLRALTQPWNFILSAFASPLLFLGGAEHSPHTLAADRIESAPEVK